MDLTGRVSSSLRCQSSSWVSRALHLSDSLVTSLLIDLCWSGSDPEVLSVSRDTAIQHDDDDDVSDETDDATYCRCPRYRKELVHWPATVDHSIICSQSRVSSQTTLDAGLWCRPVINHSIYWKPIIRLFSPAASWWPPRLHPLDSSPATLSPDHWPSHSDLSDWPAASSSPPLCSPAETWEHEKIF